MQPSIKTIIQPSTMQQIYAPKGRTIVKKTFLKKKILSVAVPRPKQHTISSQTESKKAVINNNSSNVKNRNQKQVQQKLEKLETSQMKPTVKDDPGETKVKEEETCFEPE